jgi:hypothetical protein
MWSEPSLEDRKIVAVIGFGLIATSDRDRSSDLSLYTYGVDIPDVSGVSE